MVDDVPRVLAGRYEVGELIGRGGMAEVHIGRDSRLGRTVAVKVLRSDLARDPSFQARFRREAQSAASLNHPAIVSVYDTGEDAVRSPDGSETGVPFIVMEYVEGHTVRDLLKDGSALPIDEAIEITTGVLAALEYSHQAGIVHRDIKPANVMLTPTGAVKVMDFGIARAMADAEGTMTQTQAVVGTAQYLSPEQARGEVVDTRSDLYSTGCLLFELLTGRPPFAGDSAVAVAYQHVSETPKVPSQVAPDVPESLDRITMKALTKDRDARYATAAEFRADLEAAARDDVVSAPAVAPAAATQVLAAGRPTERSPLDLGSEAQEEDPEDEPRSRGGLIAVLVILGLLLAGGIGYLIWDRLNQPEPQAETFAVPDLTGMNEAEARAALEEQNLVPDFQTEASDEVEADLAIRWEPGTGEQLEAESVVTVWISQGPDATEIPDVSGLSQSRAREVLSNAGFTNVQTTTRNEPRVAADVAIETEPAAGESHDLDAQITIVLGTGNVELEDFTGRPIAELEEHLSDLGLSSRIIQVEDPGPPGVVLDQSRSGVVPQNTQVDIEVSIEIPEAPEPPDEGDTDGEDTNGDTNGGDTNGDTDGGDPDGEDTDGDTDGGDTDGDTDGG